MNMFFYSNGQYVYLLIMTNHNISSQHTLLTCQKICFFFPQLPLDHIAEDSRFIAITAIEFECSEVKYSRKIETKQSCMSTCSTQDKITSSVIYDQWINSGIPLGMKIVANETEQSREYSREHFDF